MCIQLTPLHQTLTFQARHGVAGAPITCFIDVADVRELYVMVELTRDGLHERFGTAKIDEGTLMYHATGEESNEKTAGDDQ